MPVDALLEELKKGSLKGNFLLLSAQKSGDVPLGILNDPRALGTLKAKVKPHPKIKERLLALKDAIIVSDIQDAVELWLDYPSNNFITAEGDVLYSSGLLNLGENPLHGLAQALGFFVTCFQQSRPPLLACDE